MSVDREVTVVRYGPIPVHAVSLREAVDIIAERAHDEQGGFVLTPNLDHLALSTKSPEIRAAFARCFLSLADGAPLVILSRLLGLPLREKVSGSDLFEPLMERCARDGLAVFFIGATPDTCERAMRKLKASYPGIELAGYDSSFFDVDAHPEVAIAALRLARQRGARLIVACLPTLKTLILSRFEGEYHPAIGLGAGSALAFYVGDVPRAPAWLSRAGFEWLFRLSQEPGRLWHRYLVEDLRALPVLGRMVLDRLRGHQLHQTCRFPPSQQQRS